MAIPVEPVLLDQLRAGEPVRGIGTGGGFGYALDPAAPALAVALHGGHDIPPEWAPLMALSESDRRLEEDPATDDMARRYPNAVWGLHSRALYDLNRAREGAIPLTPEQFWGVRVFRRLPPEGMRQRVMEYYEAFYRLVGSVVTVLLERFDRCLIYDLHAYNIGRQVAAGIADPPLFNLGTALLDRSREGGVIEAWMDALRSIPVPGVPTTVAENIVFEGRGAFCARVTGWDPRILVLPTEISKVYMDERTGRLYPQRVETLCAGLGRAMAAHAAGEWVRSSRSGR